LLFRTVAANAVLCKQWSDTRLEVIVSLICATAWIDGQCENNRQVDVFHEFIVA